MLQWNLVIVFNVPSTAKSFKDGTAIYCPLQRIKGWFLHPPYRELNSGSLRGSSLTNHCTKPAPLPEWEAMPQIQDMIKYLYFCLIIMLSLSYG